MGWQDKAMRILTGAVIMLVVFGLAQLVTAADLPYQAIYMVLNVPRNASPEEIKTAYRKLVNKYHPDKVFHLGEEFRELAENRFKEIEEAYRKLMPK
jgi:DnaJ-class molecular chaperone